MYITVYVYKYIYIIDYYCESANSKVSLFSVSTISGRVLGRFGYSQYLNQTPTPKSLIFWCEDWYNVDILKIGTLDILNIPNTSS